MNGRSPPLGRELELEVASFLRNGGYRPTLNARAAHPRQTDIYAQGHGVDLLVEAKERKRRVDVSDIDALRSRLGRTTPDVIGVIFTTSDVTHGAIKEIEANRTREVLVIVGSEIDLLRAGRINLQPLIERKRQELRVQGRAYFGPVATADFRNVSLPRGSVQFRLRGESLAYFASRTGFAHAGYMMEIPDPGYGISGGDGVILPMRLTLSSVDDLRDILGSLHEMFGLSTKGAFHIRQTDVCWNGVGAEELLGAVSRWRERYQRSDLKQAHHSEDIMYVDQVRDGWVTLTTRQRVYAKSFGQDRDEHLHDSNLAIQLPGVPLDSKPFLDLCRYTGNDWGKFEIINERRCRGAHLKVRRKLQVVGTVTETSSPSRKSETAAVRSIVGVIAKNPFYRKRKLPEELRDMELRDLLAIELLLCDIRDWHDDGDIIDAYMLEGFESTYSHTVQVIRPFGTWNKIIKRVLSGEDVAAQINQELKAVADSMKRLQIK